MKPYFVKTGPWLAALLLCIGLAGTTAIAGDKKDGGAKTMTGVVSDAMCGAQHMMAGSAAECTRACVSKGSKYALVVGDKVYTLETSDKAALDQLNKLAGQNAKVTGAVEGQTIKVSSVQGS
jgi:hypothetical protein